MNSLGWNAKLPSSIQRDGAADVAAEHEHEPERDEAARVEAR